MMPRPYLLFSRSTDYITRGGEVYVSTKMADFLVKYRQKKSQINIDICSLRAWKGFIKERQMELETDVDRHNLGRKVIFGS